MKKQLTLKKVTLFVLSALLLVLMAISVAFSAGTRAFAADSGAGSSSEGTDHSGHDVGDLVTVKPATCVEPGVGTYYCNTCGRSFNVVIPADSTKHHTVELEDGTHKCTICGKEDASVILVPAESEKNDDQNIYVQAVESSDEIKNLNVPATVEHEGTEKKVHLVEEAFKETKLESVTIDSAVDIGENAFEGCKNLAEVKIVKNEEGEVTTYVAADAFDNTPFYTKNLKKDEESGISSLAIPIVRNAADDPSDPDKVVGTYLLKVELPAAESEGGGAKPRAHRRDAAAEAAEITSFTVPKDTLVIASGAFSELTDLTTVTLNAELHTVCAGAFAGTKLANVIVADGVEANSFVSVDGLTDLGLNTIYYNGTFAENLKDIFGKLFELIRYYSAAEPDDAAHPYWHFSGEGETGLPVAWSRATKLFIDASACNRFKLHEEFHSDGLLVYVTYEDGTSRLADESEYRVDSAKYQKDIQTDASSDYVITVTYKYISGTYTVRVANAYRITIDYNDGTTESGEALVYAGDPYTIPATAPTYAGHKFLGWKYGEETTLKNPGDKINDVEADVTLQAQWETLYTVSVTGDHVTAQIQGTPTDDGVEGTQTYYAKGVQITFTLTVAKGYKLTAESVKFGETTLTAGEGGTYSVTVGEKNVKVTVNVAPVEIKTEVKEATGVEPQVQQDGATATLTIGDPTKDGYRFDGWDVTVDGEAKTYNNGLTLDLANADVTVVFTAKWEKMSITRAYNAALTETSGVIKLDIYVQVQNIDATTIQNVALKVGSTYLSVAGTPTKGDVYFKLTYDITELATLNSYALDLVYGDSHVDLLDGSIEGASKVDVDVRYQIADGKLNILPKYTVTFVAENATAPENATVYGDDEYDFTKIEPQVSEGYAFLYWYYMNGETETKLQKVAVSSIAAKGVYNVTVTAKIVELYTVSTNITDYAEAMRWNTDEQTKMDLNENISIVATHVTGNNSGNAAYYSKDGDWRIYTTSTEALTFTSENGATIYSIALTYTHSNNGTLHIGSKSSSTGSEEWDGKERIVNATSFSVHVEGMSGTSGGQIQITSITIVYYGGTHSTPAQLADKALEKIGIKADTHYTEDFDLPFSTVYGVTFAWSLTVNDGDGSAEIVGDKVIVTSGVHVTQFTLTVEAKVGETTGATASYTLYVDPLDPNVANFDFSTNFTTYASGWTKYSDRTVTFSDIGMKAGENAQGINGTVAIESTMKQTQTITTCPTIKVENTSNSNYKNTKYVTLQLAEGEMSTIAAVEFGLKEWDAIKEFTNIYIEYYDGSKWTQCSEDLMGGQSQRLNGDRTVSTNQTLTNVSKVRLAVTKTLKGNQQFGLASIKLTINPPDPDVLAAKKAIDQAKIDIQGLQTKINKSEEESITLPLPTSDTAQLTWDLVETEGVELDGNTLTITFANKAKTVTLNVTASCNGKTAEATYTINVPAHLITTGRGTIDSPYTIEDAQNIVSDFVDNQYYCPDGSTKEQVYIKGYITDVGSENNYNGHVGRQNVKIASEKGGVNTLTIQYVDWNEVVPEQWDGSQPLQVGDYVVVYGFLEKHSGGACVYHDNISPNTACTYPTFAKWMRDDTDMSGSGKEPPARNKVDTVIEALRGTLPAQLSADYTLPTLEELVSDGLMRNGVSIRWNVVVTTDGVTWEAATIDEAKGILKITRGEKEVSIELHAYITCGDIVDEDCSTGITISKEGEVSGSFTITRTDNFGEIPTSDSGYKSHEWSSGDIKGTACMSGASANAMQFKGSSNSYVVSNVKTPAPIYRVTATTQSGKTAYNWTLYTSSSPYTEQTSTSATKTAIQKTTSRGQKSVTTSGTTWEFYDSNTYYFALVSNSGSSTSYLSEIKVEYKTLSDDVVVKSAAENYELPDDSKTFSEIQTYDLPTTVEGGGVTITWALTNGTSEYCSIVDDTKLDVTALPTDADATVGLTATFHLNDKTATNNYTVTIKKQSTGGGGGATTEKSFTIDWTAKEGISMPSSGYGDCTWSVKVGETDITGLAYGCKQGSYLQIRKSKNGGCIVSSVATPGRITKIEVSLNATVSGGKLCLRTSTSAYTSVTSHPSSGTVHDVKDTNVKSITWSDLEGSDTYFAIDETGDKAVVVTKIVVTYEAVSSDVGMEMPSATDLVANVNSEIPSSSSLWLYVLGGSALLVSVVSLSALAFVLIRKKHN